MTCHRAVLRSRGAQQELTRSAVRAAGRFALAVGFALVASRGIAAQTHPAPPPASLVGTWRGTSICTAAGKPACHDEVVVYHFAAAHDSTSAGQAGVARASGAVERLDLTANKVVNGREEEMGTLAFEYRPGTGVAVCLMRGWTWSFHADGGTLTGTLVNPAGVVWRNVRVARLAP
jgi:hypothetical protein